MENKNCWTCTKPNPTHKVWRESLLDYEWTCSDCHKKEYPELYNASECEKCGGALVDKDDLLCHKCYHQSVPEGEWWWNNIPI